MLYMVTFTINIPPMLAYIPYMDPMGSDLVDQILAMDEAWAVLELPVEAQN